MTESGSSPESRLVVRCRGREPYQLRPGDPPFTFGRGSRCKLRFAHDSDAGRPDLDVSRNVGTIWCEKGLWLVRNDSTSRPFDLLVQGAPIPLWPRISSDAPSIWAISPPTLDIKIEGPFGPYQLAVSVDYRNQTAPSPQQNGDVDPTTNPLRPPTLRSRIILAAKFLALPTPGEAVGDEEAAGYANAAPTLTGASVTAKTVENCVSRWRKHLEERGVTEIEGRHNINNLGRKLLAWGLLRQEDKLLLRPGP